MSDLRIGNSELISQVNHRLVMEAVRVLQPTFRAEVSRHTNLKPATISGIVNELIQAGLLRETTTAAGRTPPQAQSGRPPLMLEIDGSARHFLAIDLEPDVIRVGLVDLNINLLEYRDRMIDRFSEPGLVISQIVELCRELLSSAQAGNLHRAAISLPGLLDPSRGVLLSSTNMPKWKNVPVAERIGQQIGVPVVVDRAVRLAALYEDWIDRSESQATKLVVSLRTGVGVSLIRHGEPYVGAHGHDGEVGHTVIDPQGPACECGNRGCLDTYISASVISRRAQAMLDAGRGAAIRAAMEAGEPLRPELVYRLAKQGDADCAELVREVGRYIGIAATNLVNLFDPDCLVLSGSIDTADDIILDTVTTHVRGAALPQITENLTIRLASAKERTPLLGAAVLVARELFVLPRLYHTVAPQ